MSPGHAAKVLNVYASHVSYHSSHEDEHPDYLTFYFSMMKPVIQTSLEDIDPDEWNELNNDNSPFLRHEFLIALERHEAVGQRYGWLPRFVTLFDDSDTLCAAMPLYEKDNSYGELVFDWSWADAFHRHGIPYYPKLVGAIPYTPATGQRLLARDNDSGLKQLLIEHAINYCNDNNYSSLHVLFPDDTDLAILESSGLKTRTDVQYHWSNYNYDEFEDFLASLKRSKRKKIRQERKKVSSYDIHFKTLHGNELSNDEWTSVYRFYANTFAQKSGYATLHEGFWKEVGKTMGDRIIVIMAYHGSEPLACAINFRSNDTLYGRHWGIDKRYTWQFSGLHFETCYYRGIEYAIRHGLQHYEPGAQGEYKMSRGFVPTYTRSAHWITHPDFRSAINDYLDQEYQAVADYKESLDDTSPYKENT